MIENMQNAVISHPRFSPFSRPPVPQLDRGVTVGRGRGGHPAALDHIGEQQQRGQQQRRRQQQRRQQQRRRQRQRRQLPEQRGGRAADQPVLQQPVDRERDRGRLVRPEQPLGGVQRGRFGHRPGGRGGRGGGGQQAGRGDQQDGRGRTDVGETTAVDDRSFFFFYVFF